MTQSVSLASFDSDKDSFNQTLGRPEPALTSQKQNNLQMFEIPKIQHEAT
jgi:hypothetical protein